MRQASHLRRIDRRITDDLERVDDGPSFTLEELSRACRVDIDPLTALATGARGVGAGLSRHRSFESGAMRRARCALQLTRDLELTPVVSVLTLELLDQLDSLHSHLERLRDYPCAPRRARVRQRTDIGPATA